MSTRKVQQIPRIRYNEVARSISALYIGERITGPKQIYRVHVRGYYGDADMYETLKFDFPASDYSKVINFLNFLATQVATAYPNGRGGGDEYNYSRVVTDWGKWFVDEDSDEESEATFYWPSNYEMGGELSYESAFITYFNEKGTEYDVNFE